MRWLITCGFGCLGIVPKRWVDAECGLSTLIVRDDPPSRLQGNGRQGGGRQRQGKHNSGGRRGTYKAAWMGSN